MNVNVNEILMRDRVDRNVFAFKLQQTTWIKGKTHEDNQHFS